MRLIVLLALFAVLTRALGESLTVSVIVTGGKNVPSIFLVSSDSPKRIYASTADPRTQNYTFDIDNPLIPIKAGASSLVTKYSLVASWGGDEEERLYLGLHPAPDPQEVAVSVIDEYNIPIERAQLDKLDHLGNDIDQVYEKYYAARDFYKGWLRINGDPKNQQAIRSVRIWYDAAYELTRRQPTVIRMDDNVLDVIKGLSNLCSRDAAFQKRFENMFPPNILKNYHDEVQAANFSFVREIPKLAASGRAGDALKMNDIAAAALKKEPPDAQKIILDKQGIDMGLLNKNKAYLIQLNGK